MSVFDKLPYTVSIENKQVPIDADFRIFIDLEVCSQRNTLNAEQILKRFYKGAYLRAEQAVDKLLWFYRCGDNEELAKKQTAAAHQRAYDYEQDRDAIYQSFRLAYGIDLFTADIHWWQFQKLLFGLPKDSLFMQLIYWRTVDINKLPKYERQFVLTQRRNYAVGGNVKISKQERDNGFIKRLKNRAHTAKGG